MGFMQCLTKMKNRDEWYTPASAIYPFAKVIPQKITIWCPFDKPESEFVKVFTTGGQNVICSHIEDGKDFFIYEPSVPYDAIISNPPYSKKDAVLERLFKIGKPWAMLMNINGIFDSQKRFGLFREHGVQLFVVRGRIRFFGDENGKQAPPFQTIYVCWNLLPQTIMFEQDGDGLFSEVAE